MPKLTDADRQFVAGLVLEERSADPAVNLLRAMAEGRLTATSIPNRRMRWTATSIDDAQMPILVHLSDAADGLGPTGWRAARRLRSWCCAAVLSDQDASPPLATRLVDETVKVGRLALIEVAAERGDLKAAWSSFLAGKLRDVWFG